MWRRIEAKHFECELTHRQDDWLLRRMVPGPVADELLRTGGQLPVDYCRGCPCAGVLFAQVTIDYDEESKKGVGHVRLLNELLCHFEELLERPQYAHCVEKIKTIGSCLMVASGIRDEDSDAFDKDHLDVLLKFAIDLGAKLREANISMLELHVKLTMKIGLNCGPVTVGVVGTSRTMFDIWGSTVNLASRMCLKALDGTIQMSSEYRQALADEHYAFEHRDEVVLNGSETTTFHINCKQLELTDVLHCIFTYYLLKRRWLNRTVGRLEKYKGKMKRAVLIPSIW